jgi:hypothetical protein
MTALLENTTEQFVDAGNTFDLYLLQAIAWRE